ncbi:MAG: molybdopterin-dependent oxidoreductase [Candidatus Tectomicrobia bacterium]|uniref:Molybdopterin-dependent oxidoreductase n=1 Tax=Tectimicrobiota bacterium TaxID=2528274 RepID=A0A932FV20_UNCTE|nr:molybdopterin-dependent oxidoreductase [Candidatus Tectomicrobia bacterium]
MKENTQILSTTCANNCGGKCILKVHVRQGVIERIETAEDPKLRACARGRAYRQYVYHPDRLKHPLKRTGKRGEGKFERISWEEALDTVARELLRVKETYGPEAIFSACYSGSLSSLHSAFPYGAQNRLFDLLGGKTFLAGNASAGGGEAAGYYTYGESYQTGNDREDLLSSRLILLWGWDPAVTVLGSSTRWIMTRAREKGIRIVSIDPRYTDSAAAWAQEWIPIIPGTDTAMMVAMAYVILTEGLQDQRFLDTYTLGFDRFADYLLGREDGTPKTPTWAEPITGVKAETIVRLAREYATAKPAALQTGYGPQKTARGDQFMRAGMALAAMTGNIGIPGGSAAGNGAAPNVPLSPAFLDDFKPGSPYVSHMKWADALLEGRAGGYPSDIRLVYISFSNLLVTFQNTAKGARALQKPEFIVVHEQFLTPTARYADILLPVTTCLERADICRAFGRGYALFMHRAIGPLYEARTDLEIFQELAHRLGVGERFNPRSEEEWLDHILKPLKVEDRRRLREEGLYRPPRPEPFVAFREQIEDPVGHPFPTPSGKIEIYSQRLDDFNRPDTIPPIPQYLETWEGRSDPKSQAYPLQLLTGAPKRQTHATLHNLPWLQELEDHAVWINPMDAQKRGLKDGEPVLVYNDRGTIQVRARLTERIMPGVVSLEGCTWYDPDEEGIDRAGSANVLTRDEPSSVPLFLPHGLRSPAIGSGPTNNTNLVEIIGLEERESHR